MGPIGLACAREPRRRGTRPHAVQRLVRVIAALSFSVTVTAVPLATVSACDCAMSELPEAIRTADLAVVATSVAVVPRGTTYSISRRGRNPVIILAVLAGAPCAAE